MTVIAAALKHMLAANMPHEAILAAVEDMERGLQTDEQAERRRAADRERQRQRRLRISAESADKKDSPRVGVTRVEDKPLPTDIEPQAKKTSHGDVDAFRAGLAPDVSEEVLSEFVKVRRKKRGALTGYAAKLFREDAAKCGMSVADAAKECVRSSWITVKPEYFAGRQRAGPAPSAHKDTPANAARRRLEAIQNERRSGSETDDNQPPAGGVPGNLIRLVG